MSNKVFLLVVFAAPACGGKNKQNAEESDTPLIDTQATSADTTDRSGAMVPPEKMDQINRLLERKQMIISRCLSDAVEAGEAPKGTHVQLTVEVGIAPSGQVSKANVVRSSTELDSVKTCTTDRVREITFPTLPRQVETSYTYAMEAN